MAAQGNTEGEAPTNDISVHRDGYQKFLGWFKWGAVTSFVVAAVVVVIIS